MASGPAVIALDGVRLATPNDLARIATVAAAGFFHSPTFHYQRIHHAAYPDDTLLSYWSEYDRAINDRASIVLVAEDTLNESEGDNVYPALRTAATYTPGTGTLGSKIVVGVASIDIKPGSAYVGLFQPLRSADQAESRALPANPKRDICEERVHAYNEATGPAKARHLQGQMRLTTLAVHPAYWRRGHATRLVSWSTRLADIDGVSLGISAVPQGAIVAARAGFEEQEVIRVKRPRSNDGCPSMDATKAVDVEMWVAIRLPSGTPRSEESSGDNAMRTE